MKRYFIGVFSQAGVSMKRLMRDKMALFFTFLFPLIFLLVFGTIFGNNNSSTSFDIAIINHSQTEFAKHFVEGAKSDKSGVLKIKDVESLEDAKEKMKRSELNGIIELPKDFGEVKVNEPNAKPSGTIKVLHSKGSDQLASAMTAVMSQVANEINQAMGQPEPPIKVASEAVGDEALKSFDYTFTGLLAFSLMSMGIFGLANQMPTEKQKGAYRRLRAAPFTAGQLIIATAISYTIIALLSAVMMIVVGMWVFNFQMRGDWLLFSGFLALSAIMMVGLGLIIGAWAKNENQSAPLSNLISFPMMFLSGAFFPSFLFPEWLKSISQFIPMTPVVDGLRLISAENASLAEIVPQIGMLAAVVALVYLLAIKIFRWE